MGFRHYILAAIFIICVSALGQKTTSVQYIDSADYELIIDSLKGVFPYATQVPEYYELAFFTALSYYPELTDTRIKVKKTSIKTTLNIRPTFWSTIFNKRDNRQYILRINSCNKSGNIELKDVHYQAAIGLFGHEFAHVKDFNSVGMAGVFKRGIWYMFSDTKMMFEHSIDMLTIEQGLGWQLYEWSYYVLNHELSTDAYKEYKRKYYLTPSKIMSSLNQN